MTRVPNFSNPRMNETRVNRIALPIKTCQNLLEQSYKQQKSNHQINWANLDLSSNIWIQTLMAFVCEKIVEDLVDEVIDDLYGQFDKTASQLVGELISSELGGPGCVSSLANSKQLDEPDDLEFKPIRVEKALVDQLENDGSNCQLPIESDQFSTPSQLTNIRSLKSLERSLESDNNVSVDESVVLDCLSNQIKDSSNEKSTSVIESNDEEYSLEFENSSIQKSNEFNCDLDKSVTISDN